MTAFLAAYVGTGLAAGALGHAQAMPSVWPGAGLAFAMLALCPPREWRSLLPATGVGALAISWKLGTPWETAVAVAVAAMVCAAAGAGVARRLANGTRPDLSTLRDVGILVGAGAMVGPIAGVLAGTAVMAVLEGDPELLLWLRWALGAASGVLFVAPLLLAVPTRGLEAAFGGRAAEALASTSVGVIAALVVFGLTDAPLISIVLFPTLWAALRTGVLGAAVAVASVAVATLALTARGDGPYAAVAGPAADDLVLAQTAIVLWALVGIAVAALTLERQRAVEETHRQQLQLERLTRLESLGAVAGSVAHDFRNVLAVIFGYAERAQMATVAGRDAREDFKHLAEGIDRGRALTDQLLSFDRGKPVGAVRPLDLNEVVRDSRGFLIQVVGGEELLDVRLAPRPALVEADQMRLGQILHNLVLNARQASSPESVVIVQTGIAGDQIVLTVRDHGTGMPEAIRRRALSRGFTTKQGGTGLGLSTASTIATEYGGDVEIDSEPGRGTEVRVTLPRSIADRDGTQAPAGRASVLVVDDNEHVRLFIEVALCEIGHEVLVAGDADEALAALDRNGGIDLVISDLHLPGMDGGELYAQARRRHPSALALFITGDEVATVAQAPEAPVLVKPFGLDELAECVERLVGRPQAPEDVARGAGAAQAQAQAA